MSSATITLEGGDQLAAALRAYGAQAQKYVDDAVNATGLELRGDIVKRYQRGPASGRTYEKYNPRRTHTASAPGEAPATDTGRLASSVNFKREGAMSATVGSEIVYAAMLEFGTARIAPRPAWVPAVEAIRPKYIKRLEAALRKAAP
ncbi:HK97 gp10 family phage protein [Yoonia sp.]|uniref:HK97 gp10 family phage protein n=1 Tax=Yoonia sp. TaxID=2212373 RepID=UPI002E05C8F6|nr:HK97 gp10 family phage protein [Yoonia sp.]